MSFSNDTKNDLLLSKISHKNCSFKNFVELENSLLDSECCKKEYLKKVFLEFGSVTEPNIEYHLEIVLKDLEVLKKIVDILKYFDIHFGSVTRKGFSVLYLKDSDDISNFFSLIGAYKSLLILQNVKALKDVRNNINRVVNCETANMSKVISVSVRQVECIKYLQENDLFDGLSAELKEIALLRLNNPDSSLAELGNMMNPKLTKSGVNHRLKKIENIVDSYRR